MKNYYAFINQRFQEFMQHQLHEISNKFNLLSLSLEDLEDVLEENSPWKEDAEQVKKMKDKFLESLASSKRDVLFKNSPEVTLEEGVALITKIKIKEMNNKSVKLVIDKSPKDILNFPKTPLILFLWNYISLRLSVSSSEEVQFNFETKESFLRCEKKFIEEQETFFNEDFKNSYLEEMDYFLNTLLEN